MIHLQKCFLQGAPQDRPWGARHMSKKEVACECYAHLATVSRFARHRDVATHSQRIAVCGFVWAAHLSQNFCGGKWFFLIAHAAAECIAASLSGPKDVSTAMITEPVQPLHCHHRHHQPQCTCSESQTDCNSAIFTSYWLGAEGHARPEQQSLKVAFLLWSYKHVYPGRILIRNDAVASHYLRTLLHSPPLNIQLPVEFSFKWVLEE